MRLKRLCFGLVALAWCGAAAADQAGDIEKLETAASGHVAAFSALDARRANLSLQYRALTDQLTQRLKFGSMPKNPALLQTWQEARTTLTALSGTGDQLTTLVEELTDDAAQANALGRTSRASLATPGAEAGQQRPAAERIAAASANLNRALGQALEQRQRQAELTKSEEQAMAMLAHAIEVGRLPDSGAADATLAEMLAPPKLMEAAPPAGAATHPPADTGHWAIEFGIFPSQDDAGYIMARLSVRGIQSRFTTSHDKHNHPVYRVVTRGYATRAAAEEAAADLARHSLPPSRVVELSGAAGQ